MILNIKYLKILLVSFIIASGCYYLIGSNIVFINNIFFKLKDLVNHETQNVQNKNLIIKGLKYINKDDITNNINLLTNNLKNKNYLKIIYNNLKKNSLIKNFSIVKKSESLVEIEIIEKKVIGITIKDDIKYFIDDKGNINKASQNKQFSNLPYFSGIKSHLHANKILNLIKKSKLTFPIFSFEFIGQRRWNINLINKVKILLPENNIFKSLNLIKNLHNKYNVLNGNFIEIDLRIENKYFFKPSINKNFKSEN